MKKASLFFVLFMGFFVAASSMARAECPIPPDLNVVAPDSSLPDSLKTLAKSWWVGTWRLGGGRTMDSILIFEKVSATEAVIIHSYTGMGTQPAGYSRNIASLDVSGNQVKFKVPLSSGPMDLEYSPEKEVVKAFIFFPRSSGTSATTFTPIAPKPK
jgi:hypothetical protein